MSIDQKLALFGDGKLTADRLLAAADLKEVGVVDGRFLSHICLKKTAGQTAV